LERAFNPKLAGGVHVREQCHVRLLRPGLATPRLSKRHKEHLLVAKAQPRQRPVYANPEPELNQNISQYSASHFKFAQFQPATGINEGGK
jgi:hypothetical protein